MKYKIIILTSALTLFQILCVQARVGETVKECEARYGEPFKVTDLWSYYRKNTFLIMISYHDQKADSITYRKIETDILGKAEPLSENEISQLLSLNSPDKKFTRKKGISSRYEWETNDGSLFANYNTIERLLSIYNSGKMARFEAARKAEENEAIEGL